MKAIKKAGMASLVCCALSFQHTVLLASDYDGDTGIIDVSCLEGTINGNSIGKIREVQLLLEDDSLTVLSLSKTETTGPCEATLELTSLTYKDVIIFDGDEVEITASLISGLTLGLSNWITRLNLIAEDLTVAENETDQIALPGGIILESLEVLLASGDTVPDFISVFESNLVIEPQTGDAGVYSLRLEWEDQVELLEITVQEGMGGDIDVSAQPVTLPTFSNLNLYSSSSPFNTPIGDEPTIDPDSDTLVVSIVESLQMVVQVNQFSAPVYFADSSTPRQDVELACGEVWELGVTQMGNIPIPDWAEASFDVDGDPPVVGCGEDAGQDNFMVILDLENRCEYDFWQARQEDGMWVSSFGVGVEMDGTGVLDNGLSARGSGFAFLGGVIWPDELANGKINHLLSFSYEFTKEGGPVAPATDSDGVTTAESALPEGAIIQLDPDFDLSTLNLEPYELTIATALQEYGMILVDSGSAGPVGFYAIDPGSVTGDMWGDIWGDEDFVALENLDVSTLPFRVLELGPQDANFQQNLQLNMGSCSAYQ
jgi:hypothetical protein